MARQRDSPEQVRVLPISDKSAEYAQEVLGKLRDLGIRATIDDGSERIQAKVKVATDMKVPYLAVVGPRDAENREVSIRAFGIERNLGSMGLEAFLETVAAESSTRGETRLVDRFETIEAS